MISFSRPSTQRALLFAAAFVAFLVLVTDFFLNDGRTTVRHLPFYPSAPQRPELPPITDDGHPIYKLVQAAEKRFRDANSGRSKTFAELVKKYREKYGRHPPPNFDKWYLFARERNVYNLDDFDQIHDDLRPFWSYTPFDLRALIKGMLDEDPKLSSLNGVFIRNGEVSSTHGGWRVEQFERMMAVFAEYLPDMDIAMNRLDQPRVLVKWEDLQKHLQEEQRTRVLHPEVTNEWSRNAEIPSDGEKQIAEWFKIPGKPYMNYAKLGCPPQSHARVNTSASQVAAEKTYKLADMGGIITNYNLSSDLCTVGPEISDLHGLLFSASTLCTSQKLVPIFGECKVNVNNDILFPANMYFKHDERYEYADDGSDPVWDAKQDRAIWRGVTSGGVQIKETWRRLHRHRFVLMSNATELNRTHTQEPLLIESTTRGVFSNTTNFIESTFSPGRFAEKYLDVGFVQLVWCVPDDKCGWLKPELSTVPETKLAEQFRYKYLLDVDGHSFSGRWPAFLKSRSAGIKATIFREWHDSRMFEWLHFVPMDNRFDDYYTLMTYLLGWDEGGEKEVVVGHHVPGSPESGPPSAVHEEQAHGEGEGEVHPDANSHPNPEAEPAPAPVARRSQRKHIAAHENVAKQMADKSSEWARKVLRIQDMEVYMFRLMLEYARLCDDNRDRVGYGGDGSEVVEKKEWSEGW